MLRSFTKAAAGMTFFASFTKHAASGTRPFKWLQSLIESISRTPTFNTQSTLRLLVTSIWQLNITSKVAPIGLKCLECSLCCRCQTDFRTSSTLRETLRLRNGGLSTLKVRASFKKHLLCIGRRKISEVAYECFVQLAISALLPK
jgi:hypothetical protein